MWRLGVLTCPAKTGVVEGRFGFSDYKSDYFACKALPQCLHKTASSLTTSAHFGHFLVPLLRVDVSVEITATIIQLIIGRTSESTKNVGQLLPFRSAMVAIAHAIAANNP